MFALEPTLESCKFAAGPDRIRQQWPAISGQLQRRWHRLTADDILFGGGSAGYLARVLQDRHGIDRQEARLQVHEFESGL